LFRVGRSIEIARAAPQPPKNLLRTRFCNKTHDSQSKATKTRGNQRGKERKKRREKSDNQIRNKNQFWLRRQLSIVEYAQFGASEIAYFEFGCLTSRVASFFLFRVVFRVFSLLCFGYRAFCCRNVFEEDLLVVVEQRERFRSPCRLETRFYLLLDVFTSF